MSKNPEALSDTTTNDLEIPQEERTPLIKSKISQILDLVTVTEEDKKDGFELTYTFHKTGEIEPGSMGFSYWGDPGIGESLSFYRFHGEPAENGNEFIEGTTKDKGIMFSLYWNHNNLNMPDGFSYSEWDAKDETVRGEPDKTRPALDRISGTIAEFKKITEALAFESTLRLD